MSGKSFFSIDLSRQGLVAVQEYTRSGQAAEPIGRMVYKVLNGQREIVLLTNDESTTVQLSYIFKLIMEANRANATDIMDIKVKLSGDNRVKKVSFVIAGNRETFELTAETIERIKDAFRAAPILDQLHTEGSKTIFHLMNVSDYSPIVMPFLDPAHRAARKALRAELQKAITNKEEIQVELQQASDVLQISDDGTMSEDDVAALQTIFEETSAELESAEKEVKRLNKEIYKNSFPPPPVFEGNSSMFVAPGQQLALEEKKERD